MKWGALRGEGRGVGGGVCRIGCVAKRESAPHGMASPGGCRPRVGRCCCVAAACARGRTADRLTWTFDIWGLPAAGAARYVMVWALCPITVPLGHSTLNLRGQDGSRTRAAATDFIRQMWLSWPRDSFGHGRGGSATRGPTLHKTPEACSFSLVKAGRARLAGGVAHGRDHSAAVERELDRERRRGKRQHQEAQKRLRKGHGGAWHAG